jgi:hypothetical protein
MLRLPCPKCQRPIAIETGKPEALNGSAYSVIIVPHKPTLCDCGSSFVPQLGSAQLQVNGLFEVSQSKVILAQSTLGLG